MRARLKCVPGVTNTPSTSSWTRGYGSTRRLASRAMTPVPTGTGGWGVGGGGAGCRAGGGWRGDIGRASAFAEKGWVGADRSPDPVLHGASHANTDAGNEPWRAEHTPRAQRAAPRVSPRYWRAIHRRNTAIAYEPTPSSAPLCRHPLPASAGRASGSVKRRWGGAGGVRSRDPGAELWRSCPEGWDGSAKVGACIPNRRAIAPIPPPRCQTPSRPPSRAAGAKRSQALSRQRHRADPPKPRPTSATARHRPTALPPNDPDQSAPVAGRAPAAISCSSGSRSPSGRCHRYR